MADLNLADYMDDNFQIDHDRMNFDILVASIIKKVPSAAPYKNLIKRKQSNGKIEADLSGLPTEVAAQITEAFQ